MIHTVGLIVDCCVQEMTEIFVAAVIAVVEFVYFPLECLLNNELYCLPLDVPSCLSKTNLISVRCNHDYSFTHNGC